MTAATTTMTTMSNDASMVSMPFLFPVIFFIFFTPFSFPVGSSQPVSQIESKPGLREKARLIGSLVPLLRSGGFEGGCSCVVSSCYAQPGVCVVYPEDPGLCRLLATDDAFHHKLEKQCLGAFPVFEP